MLKQRKPDKADTTVVSNFRMDSRTVAKVGELAAHEHRTWANMLRVLIDEALANRNTISR